MYFVSHIRVQSATARRNCKVTAAHVKESINLSKLLNKKGEKERDIFPDNSRSPLGGRHCTRPQRYGKQQEEKEIDR